MEVWCRKKLERKETLQTGTSGKVLCMALDNEEEILSVGTADGKIQVNEFISVFISQSLDIRDETGHLSHMNRIFIFSDPC